LRDFKIQAIREFVTIKLNMIIIKEMNMAALNGLRLLIKQEAEKG